MSHPSHHEPNNPITFNTPLCINNGQVQIHSRVMLAPMAGITDVVFRGLVRQAAPKSLICTEMISSNGLVYSQRWDANILDKSLQDHPIAYQLAAHREEVLIRAAEEIVARHSPDTLDLNMGCPVKKITGNFEGCALMKDVALATQLVRAVSKAVPIPVTVKCRLGWDETSKNYLDFAEALVEAGAKMITLHARTRAQGYRPGVDWEAFALLKQRLGPSIPVIGNGDIVTPQDAHHVLSTYGIDGVMIGRGCQGSPWQIGRIDHYLKTGELLPEPTLHEKLDWGWQHLTQMVAYKGETVGVREMRGQLPWYVAGFSGASVLRDQLTKVTTLSDVETIFDTVRATYPELAEAI